MGTIAYLTGMLRVIVYVDKQANGAAAAITDIVKTAALASFRNMDQVDRFDILMDKVFKIGSGGTNALHTDEGKKYWKINKKCNYPVHFSSTTGAITELKSNNIGILYLADVANVNAAVASVCRVKFVDA